MPLKWHICPYKKKYRCVKRDANSKVIEKREVEIQTEERKSYSVASLSPIPQIL